MQLIRIDFTEDLGQGQFVEIRNPKLLPWGVQKKFANAAPKEGDNAGTSDFVELMVTELIRNGSLLDEDGQPIQFPITKANIDVVPGLVFEAVAAKFQEVRGKKTPDLPKN